MHYTVGTFLPPESDMTTRELLWNPTAAALFSGGATVLSSWLVKHANLSLPGRVAVALLAVPPLVFFLVAQLRWVRRRDEFVQRIQLEALAMAFGGSLVLGLVLIQLRQAGALPPIDPSFAWAAMVVLYVVGFVVAYRRYR